MKEEVKKSSLKIPPFRVQSIDFMTVSISTEKPFIKVIPIADLDYSELENLDFKKIEIKVTQQNFKEIIVLKGKPTNRNIIMHIRECYRMIYRQARNLGVRSEMDSLRALVVSDVFFYRKSNNEIVIEPSIF